MGGMLPNSPTTLRSRIWMSQFLPPLWVGHYVLQLLPKDNLGIFELLIDTILASILVSQL